MRSQWTFPVKDQITNTLGFLGHMISVVAAQLCHCSVKATLENMEINEHGYISVKLYLQKGDRLDLAHSIIVCQLLA